jgi:hypothetical protein
MLALGAWVIYAEAVREEAVALGLVEDVVRYLVHQVCPLGVAAPLLLAGIWPLPGVLSNESPQKNK